MADISKIKLPDGTIYDIKALNATDTKVEQIVTTNSDNNEYRVLLSGNANDTTETTAVRKPITLTYNCKTHTLSVIFVNAQGGISTGGQIEASHVKSRGAVVAEGAVYSDNGIYGNQICARYYSDTDEDYVDTIQLDGDTGRIYCNSMSVIDISDQYTPSKTSGNWSIGSDDGVYRIKAYKMGNLVQISIAFHGNGNAVPSGSNGFVGAITGGALPVSQITLNGFYSSSILAATLDTDGSLTVRPFSASCTLSNASRAYLTGTFICADP